MPAKKSRVLLHCLVVHLYFVLPAATCLALIILSGILMHKRAGPPLAQAARP
ncbi:hypothetical protein H4V96_000938 [Janthinobacterium sp. CG_23.4]|nr:hypothetical protein [Janthinobacterium sp. CG_23.4]